MKPLTHEWGQKAEGDYTAAETLRQPENPVYDAICFHAQQCVEKYLRMSCGGPNPNGNGHMVGTTELTAANGDTLCAEFDAEPLEDNIVRGTYRFVSGPGQFSDVSGEANFVGVTMSDHSNNVHVVVDFLGRIQY